MQHHYARLPIKQHMAGQSTVTVNSTVQQLYGKESVCSKTV